MSGLAPSRWLLERVAGIDRRRPLPALAAETFTQWFKRRPVPPAPPRGEVVLFDDTFVTYNAPWIGQAAVQFLETAGYRVVLVDRKCCGRPMISKGMLDEARENSRWNVAQLAPYAKRGVPIVGLEPSCLFSLRDEFPVMGFDKLASSALLFEEFLAREPGRLKLKEMKKEALLHGHCHQKAFDAMPAVQKVLALVPGLKTTVVETSCCGMAGSFGYEAEHYEVSMKMAGLSLLPAVKQSPEETLIVADGTSCRHQIAHGASREAVHVARVLADALA
jgi:Fe-S oxidoreductase